MKLSLQPGPESGSQAASHVREAARSFGLSAERTERLAGIVAQLFQTPCHEEHSHLPVEMVLHTHRDRIHIHLKMVDPDLEFLDLSKFLGETPVAERIKVERLAEGVRLTLVCERPYPDEVQSSRSSTFAEVRHPNPEELRVFLSGVRASFPVPVCPANFSQPERILAMLEDECCGVVVAFGTDDEVLGGLLWRPHNENVVTCSGPFVLHPSQTRDIEKALFDHLMLHLARTSVSGVVLTPPSSLDTNQFDRLGQARWCGRDGEKLDLQFYYRYLKEDTGSVVSVHPKVEAFVNEFYDRLALPREVVVVEPEIPEVGAALAADLDTGSQWASIRLLQPGTGLEEKIELNLKLLKKHGFFNVWAELEMSFDWQAILVPPLLAAGFRPAFILPQGGRGDLLVMTREENS